MSDDASAVPESRTAQLRLADSRDRDALADFLARVFPERTHAYWLTGLVRMIHLLGESSGLGYVLEAEGRIVGALLTLKRPDQAEGEAVINLSSWYVEPAYRHLGMMLDKAATRDKATTYTNISPEPFTHKLIAAMGYHSLNEDTLIVAPWLSAPRLGVRVETYDPQKHDEALVSRARMAHDHAAMGCRVLVAWEGAEARLFIFQDKPLPGLKQGAVHVIFTEDMACLARLAGPLGRALLKSRRFLWKVDGARVPKGLIGLAFKGRSSRWAKGAHPPGPNDLAYTELVVFGP